MMRLIERLESVGDENYAPFDHHVIAKEKEKISFFNVMEYMPVLGSVIGSAEVLYGVIKIAVEIIRGIGNRFVKNPDYDFKKELGSGVGTLGRGLFLMVAPIFSGIYLYSMDKDRVWKYNHQNAVALLGVGDLTERDVDIAQEYAKKLPYMNNEDLDAFEEIGDYGDLSMRYSWAVTRKGVMRCIANKYSVLGITDKAKAILDVIDRVEPETLERKEKEKRAQEKYNESYRQYQQRRSEEEAKRREAQYIREQQEHAERLAKLRAAHA